MIHFKDVPYRKWHNGQLIETKIGKRLMSMMGTALKNGAAVEWWQSQPLTRVAPIGAGTPDETTGTVYDTISMTIDG